jgi:hypothetical protein
MELRAFGRWSLAAVTCLVALAPSCNVTPLPPPVPGSWLVLLCKAADAPQEPHPTSYYEELFSRTQRDLLFDYFDVASNHALDVSGSKIHGWFSMTVKTADIGPTVRNNSTPITRDQTARDCRASALGGILATGVSVDPNDYVGVITVINVPVDAGATGKSVVLSNQAETEVGFVTHEMLHVLGLDHSYTISPDASADHTWHGGTDAEYGDCWDMMSYLTCVFRFTTSHGIQGPELEGAYREKLTWMPPGRVFVQVAYTSSPSTITLAPVSLPARPGYLLAKIEVPNQGYYVVEYRESNGFDRAIPSSAVVIREQRNNSNTYLVTRQNGSTGWRKGDRFTDVNNYLSITVDDIVAGAATVTINPAFVPGGVAQLGDRCGDKYRGVVIPCAGALRCGQRGSPPLVSIDYYCQP